MTQSIDPEPEDICPKCGGNLVFFRQNSTQGYYCSKSDCQYSCVTTYLPEIVKDTTIYEVYITSLGTNWKQNIVFLALNFNLNIQEARKFKIPGQLLLKADAVKVFEIRQRLRDRKINIVIKPKYKYDMWDINYSE